MWYFIIKVKVIIKKIYIFIVVVDIYMLKGLSKYLIIRMKVNMLLKYNLINIKINNLFYFKDERKKFFK